MFDAVFEMLGAWGPRAKNPWLKGAQNAMAAYEAAWSQRDDTTTSVDLFVAELKAHNVPGAYTRPEHRADLYVWFDSWDRGRTPTEVKDILRERYESRHE